MSSKFHTWLMVGFYAFVPWVAVLFLLKLIIHFPRALFVALHYLLNVLVFGYVFHQYYEAYPQARPFSTTITAMFFLFMYEAVLFRFFTQSLSQFLTYVDWIFPAFLITTSLYFVGFRKDHIE